MTSEASETPGTLVGRERPFLGWPMVAIACVAQFVSNGVTLSIVGNLVGPMGEDFGVAPTVLGIAPGLAILVIGICGPFIGRALDRGLARRLMTFGSLLTGTGLVVLSYATTLQQVALCWVFMIAVGVALFGTLPSMTLASNWFSRRRGLALGITVAGATLASYFAPATVQWLIDDSGWRTALRFFGYFTLAVSIPIFGTFVVGRPEEVGQLPDGDRAPEPDASEAGANISSPPIAPGELMKDSRLWLSAVGFGLIMTSPVVLISLLIEFGKSLGFTGQEANFFYAAMVPFSIAGKIVIGGLADVAPLKPSVLLVVVVNMLVWGLFLTEPSYSTFVAIGALYGIGIGGAAPLHGVLIGRLFGRINFGTASGLGGMAGIPLLVAANIGSQVLLGATESYELIFRLQIGFIALGGLLVLILEIPSASDSQD